VEELIGVMRRLLERPEEARELGEGAQRAARERFGIERFAAEWDQALREVCG
jgi:glycosyltransferase involved in cell wall biosynthesis